MALVASTMSCVTGQRGHVLAQNKSCKHPLQKPDIILHILPGSLAAGWQSQHLFIFLWAITR
jgi:hypothetical protein